MGEATIMSLNLLNLPELSERQIEMLAKVIADWCDANSVDVGGDCAQAAYAAAVDLLSANTNLSAGQLRQALDVRMAEKRREEPSL
ncbi:hypothetical protein CPT34_08350 [Rhizobium sophoriradicis]|uniref:Uncharacterized protein n=1 Tax=Rhizobium sophoriradicis TaxID=1535245 RepID=A0A2A5KWS7_9HYPH|nr:hypothetical protein CPT34_08350 [Rhizobium sophoriradicis]